MKISRDNMSSLIDELRKLRKRIDVLEVSAADWYDEVENFEVDKRDAEWTRYQIAQHRDKLERELDEFTDYVAWFFDYLFGEKRALEISKGIQSTTDGRNPTSGETEKDKSATRQQGLLY